MSKYGSFYKFNYYYFFNNQLYKLFHQIFKKLTKVNLRIF